MLNILSCRSIYTNFSLRYAVRCRDLYLGHVCARSIHNSLEYEPLLDIIERRRAESRRSIMVQVKGPQSAQDLYSYCSTCIGPVKGMHFYQNTFTKVFSSFYIVEFENEACVSQVLEKGSHAGGTESGIQPVPVTSPFLWLSAAKEENGPPPPSSAPPPSVHNEAEALAEINTGHPLSDQMYQLWKREEIPDSHARARFLVCRQVELAVQGMFCHATVLPFGSSVNGFGQIHGDQDMILTLNPQPQKERQSRLVFHSKSTAYGGDRVQTRRYCDQISNIIQVFLPGCQDVQKILYARVPIIKYRQELAGLDCDLSMTSTSGLYMSCLLHVWGGTDWRVRPLVAAVKQWARTQNLVKDVRPTNFFTNFTLVMLVVCYLQQVHKMLPTTSRLQELGSERDVFTCEDGVSVSFLHNISPHLRSVNQCFSKELGLHTLLHGFFQFYCEMDFGTKCLDPILGNLVEKNKQWLKSQALDILNPLEPDLNVSYNVSPVAVKLFTDRCREADKKFDKILAQRLEPDLSLLFGKDRGTDGHFAIPKILDVGLTRDSHSKSKTKAERTTSSDSGSKIGDENANAPLAQKTSKRLSINLDRVFSGPAAGETAGLKDNFSITLQEIEAEKKRLQKAKSLRAPNKQPVFKQNL